MGLKVFTGDINVSRDEFKREMETLLEENDKLNSVTQTMINKIIELFETATKAKEAIETHGVLLSQVDGRDNVKLVPNPAVAMQNSAISGMSKLISQLELDKLEHDTGDEL